MVIKSPFKDYYDCMQGTDQDKVTKFIRQPAEEKKGWKWPFPDASTTYHRYSSIPCLSSNTHIVGFCGKIYGVVELSWEEGIKAPDRTFCHNMADVEAWIVRHLNEAEMVTYEGRERHMRRYRKFQIARQHDHPASGTRRFYEKFFEDVENQKAAHEQIFIEKAVPVFVATFTPRQSYLDSEADAAKMTYNANLRRVEFFRVLSPALAYQELTTYIYNTAIPMKPIPVFDDVTMAESKGFDKKTSFRKDPIRKRKR
jgi:hypothetical protein